MAAVICELIGDICRPVCNGLGFGCREIFKSPFFPYLALTFALSTPGVVYGLKGISSACGSLRNWLLVNAILCAAHMLAAWYLVDKIRDPVDSFSSQNADVKEGTPATKFSIMAQDGAPGSENSFQRIRHVLCYGTYKC